MFWFGGVGEKGCLWVCVERVLVVHVHVSVRVRKFKVFCRHIFVQTCVYVCVCMCLGLPMYVSIGASICVRMYACTWP